MTDDVTQPAVIGGDGIGPEVTEQALHVLEQTVGSDVFATHEYHLGAAHWKATGEVLTTPLWPRLPRKSPSCSTLSVLP